MKRTTLFVTAFMLLATPLLACDGLFSQIRQGRIERIQVRQQARASYSSTGSYAASSGSFAQSSGTSFGASSGSTRVIVNKQRVAPMSSAVYEGTGCTNCQ